MQYHTYTALMAALRCLKGVLTAAETWVRKEWENEHPSAPSDTERDQDAEKIS